LNVGPEVGVLLGTEVGSEVVGTAVGVLLGVDVGAELGAADGIVGSGVGPKSQVLEVTLGFPRVHNKVKEPANDKLSKASLQVRVSEEP